MNDTVKVRIELTIDVPIEDWALDNGVEATSTTVRNDVKEWAYHSFTELCKQHDITVRN